MGTGNFYKVKASRYFAIMMGYEDNVINDEGEETGETEYRQPEEFECEMILEGIQEVLTDQIKEYSEDTSNTSPRDDLRSFEGRILGTFRDCKQYGDAEVAIHVTVCIRGAYYEGATLDYYFDFEVNDTYDEIPDSDYIAEDLEWIWGFNAGFAKIQSKHIKNWFMAKEEEYAEEIEKVLSSVSTPLGESARFSNGETWYEKVKEVA